MSFYYETLQSPISSVINSITLSNATFDEVILSTDMNFDADKSADYFPDDWYDSTKLHATFNNTVIAGGLEYDFGLEKSQMASFKILRRATNELNWITIGHISGENISIENGWLYASFIDRTATPNEIYQYMVTSIQYGSDVYSVPVENEVKCWTDGIAISDKDTTYYTMLEANLSNITQNKASTVIEPIHGKYPYTFKTGDLNYISGDASGLFAPMTDECSYIFDNEIYQNIVWKYREQLREWLCNGEDKILKFYDGRNYLISVTDTISDDDSEHNFKNITTFSFVEIGDINSTTALIESGFIDEETI